MASCSLIFLFAVAAAVDLEAESKEKTDLSSAETRVLPYGGYETYEPTAALGLGDYGLNRGPGWYRPHGLVNDFQLGYHKSGLNEGALNLGNSGSDYYHGGHYNDGLYREGGLQNDEAYEGVERYKDNKQHLADDFARKAYFSGAQGARKDVGNGQIFDKSQGYAQNAYNTLGDKELSGHNKGHHKTGFKKSYHKDESGHDESYYDSDHDEGNREAGKKYGEQLGTNFASNNFANNKLKESQISHNGHDDYEGNGKLFAINHGLKDYGRGGFYKSLGSGQSANKYGSRQYLNDGYGSKYGNAGYYGPGPYGPYGY